MNELVSRPTGHVFTGGARAHVVACRPLLPGGGGGQVGGESRSEGRY